MTIPLDRVRALQSYALTHPLAQAGHTLSRHHFVDARDRDGGGIRVALSLNK